MIKPINKFILVKPDKNEEKTESGLIIAKDRGEKTESVAIGGIVKALSKEIEKVKVKVNDKVLVSKWDAQKAFYSGEEYLLVKQKDILGIIE